MVNKDFVQRMGINGYHGAGMDGKLDAYGNKLKENKKLDVRAYFKHVAVTEEQINQYRLRWLGSNKNV